MLSKQKTDHRLNASCHADPAYRQAGAVKHLFYKAILENKNIGNRYFSASQRISMTNTGSWL